MEVYGENDGPARLNREERVRVAGMLKGKTAMAGIDLREVREAIARAERTKRGTDGRVLQIGPHVAEMVTRLVVLEGSEEAGNGEIHKTNADMRCQETSIKTEKKLRTAKRVAKDEGLVEIWTGPRPGDGLLTTWYRLDLWQVARAVNRSEIENTELLLEREGRRSERDKLNKKLRALRVAEKDLNLIDGPDSTPEPLPNSHIPPVKKSALQESTQEVTSVGTNVPTPVRDEAPEAGQIMKKIYHRMEERGFSLDHEEYGFNVGQVGKVLAKRNPTTEELENLPDGFVEHFVVEGKLDADKALRRMRRQKARSVMMANGEAAGTSQGKGSPDHVVEAIRWHDDGYTRTLAAVARQWDFRKDEVPPWPVMSQLGNNDVERNKYLKRLRRLAREAMKGAA